VAWNIDVILIKDGHNRRLEELVPDILVPRYEFLGFDDATSSRLYENISAGVIPGWGIVFDVGHRSRRDTYYWRQVSAGTAALLVHLGANPMFWRYVNGQLAVEAQGIQACRAHLTKPPSANFADLEDGESVAQALIEQELGASLFDATSFVGFTVFELDRPKQ
jgi:hypothetical protein